MSDRAAYIRLIKNGRTGKITKLFMQPLSEELPIGTVVHSARIVIGTNGPDGTIVFDITGEVQEMVDSTEVEDE